MSCGRVCQRGGRLQADCGYHGTVGSHCLSTIARPETVRTTIQIQLPDIDVSGPVYVRELGAVYGKKKR